MYANLLTRFGYFLADFIWYLILIITFLILSAVSIIKVYKSRTSPKRKKIYLSIIFTGFTIVLIFAAYEAYFRYIYDEPDGLGFLKVDKKWHQRHDVYNNYFFRDRDFTDIKEKEVTRIGVMGDSITFGGGIENVEDRFSNILEKKLKQSGRNVEVYNLGKSGYDTTEEIKEYQRVRHLSFDILLWQYFTNDIQPQKSTGTPIIQKYSQRDKIITTLSDWSYFFDYLYWRFSSRYKNAFWELRTADIAHYSNESRLNEHKKEIADFIKTLEKDKTKVVVIMFPSPFLLGPDYPVYVHKIMGDVFKQNGAIFIDLLPDLIDKDKRQLMASRFDPHPNEAVHAIAAQRLFEKFTSLRL